VIAPLGVIRPIALVVPWSANQRFPSAPAAMSAGELPGLPPFAAMPYSVIAPSGAAPATPAPNTTSAPGSSANTARRFARPLRVDPRKHSVMPAINLSPPRVESTARGS
jgi:hypothetical protein